MSERQRSMYLSSFFAPRGHARMYQLGMQIAQQYLTPFDKLIGIIGEAGSGKSALIRGMFPGLDLTNDDEGVYVRPLPILDIDRGFAFFSPHTYHLDIRFENGFTQMSVLAEAITEAIHQGKRVIVEHFDLVYPLLEANAHLLIGVGEEIVVSRPTIFGPDPQKIKGMVYSSLPYRLMAHTAEDLCELCLPEADYQRCGHDDVRHGFVITFPETCPDFDIHALEQKVKAIIAEGRPVTHIDDHHVSIGDAVHPCTGPRIHVTNTNQIENFHLLDHFMHDRFNHRYLLVGCVGEGAEERLRRLDAVKDVDWE